MHGCVHVCICVPACADGCVQVYVCKYALCVCMGVCMCVCVYVSVCELCVIHCLLYKTSKILFVWPSPVNTNFGESLSCVDIFMVRFTWPGLVFF